MSAPERSAEAVADLDALTRRLRRDCPWDRDQDARSIVPHTVEEAYELADAAARDDDDKLLDELGDVLFQVHFLALLLEERGAGDLAAVADHCREKLIRRHPHVFGREEGAGPLLEKHSLPSEEPRPLPTTAGEVLKNWDRIKVEEEGQGAELFGEVPENLPGLLYARKLQRRAAERLEGADLAPSPLEAAGRARQAIAELEAVVAGGSVGEETADREAIETALGEALFALVDAARQLRCDPELALRGTARRFRKRHEKDS